MAISASQTITFDGRLTATINKFLSRNAEDLLLGHLPAFTLMKEKGNIVTGGLGAQIQVPLMVPQAGGPSTAGVADPYAELSHVETVGLTSAYFIPAEYARPLSAPDYEMKLQGSETKRVDYIGYVLKRGVKDFLMKLNSDWWAAEGAAGSNGALRTSIGSIRTYLNRGTGNQVSGDATLAEQDGTAIGTTPLTSIGGIDRDTNGNTFWSTPCVTATTALSLEVVNNAISLATRGTDVPELCFIGRKGFDSLAVDLQAVTQATLWNVPSVLKKYSAFYYRGVYFLFDDNVPAGTSGGTNVQMLMFNPEYFGLHCETIEPKTMKREDPKRLLQLWIMAWYGQFVTSNPGRGGNVRYSDLTI